MVRNYTELLQPHTLAAFPPWGSSEGASRAALTGGKINLIFLKKKDFEKNNFIY